MTNQASEDDTRKGIIGELSRVQLYAKDHPYSVTATDEADIEKAADAIQSLIRTEKLKLLAEVRERVVRISEPLPKRGDVSPDIYVEVIHRVEGRNSLRAEQINLLTKMEAEL